MALTTAVVRRLFSANAPGTIVTSPQSTTLISRPAKSGPSNSQSKWARNGAYRFDCSRIARGAGLDGEVTADISYGQPFGTPITAKSASNVARSVQRGALMKLGSPLGIGVIIFHSVGRKAEGGRRGVRRSFPPSASLVTASRQ